MSAWVTAKGSGAAVACLAAQRDLHVYIAGRTTEAKLESLMVEIAQHGGTATAVVLKEARRKHALLETRQPGKNSRIRRRSTSLSLYVCSLKRALSAIWRNNKVRWQRGRKSLSFQLMKRVAGISN